MCSVSSLSQCTFLCQPPCLDGILRILSPHVLVWVSGLSLHSPASIPIACSSAYTCSQPKAHLSLLPSLYNFLPCPLLPFCKSSTPLNLLLKSLLPYIPAPSPSLLLDHTLPFPILVPSALSPYSPPQCPSLISSFLPHTLVLRWYRCPCHLRTLHCIPQAPVPHSEAPSLPLPLGDLGSPWVGHWDMGSPKSSRVRASGPLRGSSLNPLLISLILAPLLYCLIPLLPPSQLLLLALFLLPDLSLQ